MSGHSKWQQIRHKKALTDQKRGQVFSKLAKLITIAAREGEDPETNPKLKTAIEKAREFNLPNENIQKAIKRAGEKDKAQFETLLLETIGPSKTAILIEAITDNKNRTIAEIKNILTKNDLKMAREGSLLWQFDKKGLVKLVKPGAEPTERHEHLPVRQDIDEETFELELIEAGAEDITHENNKITIYTKPEAIFQVKTIAEEKGFEVESATLEFVPKTPIKIEDEKVRERLNNLFDQLDEHEDVEEIYSNIIL